MAENKTKPGQASVTSYVAAIANETRRADAKAIAGMMQEATGEKPRMWGPSIIGFGTCHYRYESGREGDMPLVGVSPRSGACVLYGLQIQEGTNPLLAGLGKFKTGKGCLYISKLADVNTQVLRKLIAQSVAKRRTKD